MLMALPQQMTCMLPAALETITEEIHMMI